MMKVKTQKRWLLIALAGMLYWFFGNLYEAIVFSPNWVVESLLQLERLQAFFIHTSPTHYFVPVTQLATLIVWGIYFANKQQCIHRELGKAALFALLATLINIFIVSTVVLKIFDSNLHQYNPDYLNELCWRWNYLNVIRMTLTLLTIIPLFNAFRKLDR